jgi:hypothetical protein
MMMAFSLSPRKYFSGKFCFTCLKKLCKASHKFFKWMKGHLRIKSFWGNTENAVRIQVYVAIATYCTVAIIERTLELNRSIYEVMRILGSSLLAKDNIKDLFQSVEAEQSQDNGQLKLEFEAC